MSSYINMDLLKLNRRLKSINKLPDNELIEIDNISSYYKYKFNPNIVFVRLLDDEQIIPLILEPKSRYIKRCNVRNAAEFYLGAYHISIFVYIIISIILLYNAFFNSDYNKYNFQQTIEYIFSRYIFVPVMALFVCFKSLTYSYSKLQILQDKLEHWDFYNREVNLSQSNLLALNRDNPRINFKEIKLYYPLDVWTLIVGDNNVNLDQIVSDNLSHNLSYDQLFAITNINMTKDDLIK